MPPFVAHVLVPLMTHSSLASSYVARVRIAPTSLPASGSDEQNARDLEVAGRPEHLRHPLADLLGVPFAETPAAASAVPTIASPMPASPQNSSSMATGSPSPVSSKCWVAKKSRE